MISCNLQGGLGNQMFQIAATYALAKRHNDISGFNLNNCLTPMQGKTSNHYKDNIFSKINTINEFKYENFYSEPTFSYQEIPYSKNLLLNGYFQSELYFNDFKEDIINLFNISDSDKTLISELIPIFTNKDKPITSVSIRRGDYLNNPEYHNPCGLEYFKNAMNLIGDSYFIFMSDDMKWVIENFGLSDNHIFPNLKNDVLDLTLMTMCNNNIISNSTFSWWGAYLNATSNTIKIAPNEWFGPKGPQDYFDVLPNNWIKINN